MSRESLEEMDQMAHKVQQDKLVLMDVMLKLADRGNRVPQDLQVAKEAGDQLV